MKAYRVHLQGGACVGRMSEPDPYAVDCRICMYHIGRYVPIVKLREHQLKTFTDWLYRNDHDRKP